MTPDTLGARLRSNAVAAAIARLVALLSISVLLGLAITAPALGSPASTGLQVCKSMAVAVCSLTARHTLMGEHPTRSAPHRASEAHVSPVYGYDRICTQSAGRVSRHSMGVRSERPVAPVVRGEGRGVRLRAPPVPAAEDGEGLIASRLRAMRADPDRGLIGDGTPRTNIAQNKQFNDAIKAAERQLGRTLSKDERSAVHRENSGQDYGCHDIVDEVLGMFGGGG